MPDSPSHSPRKWFALMAIASLLIASGGVIVSSLLSSDPSGVEAPPGKDENPSTPRDSEPDPSSNETAPSKTHPPAAPPAANDERSLGRPEVSSSGGSGGSGPKKPNPSIVPPLPPLWRLIAHPLILMLSVGAVAAVVLIALKRRKLARQPFQEPKP